MYKQDSKDKDSSRMVPDKPVPVPPGVLQMSTSKFKPPLKVPGQEKPSTLHAKAIQGFSQRETLISTHL